MSEHPTGALYQYPSGRARSTASAGACRYVAWCGGRGTAESGGDRPPGGALPAAPGRRARV